MRRAGHRPTMFDEWYCIRDSSNEAQQALFKALRTSGRRAGEASRPFKASNMQTRAHARPRCADVRPFITRSRRACARFRLVHSPFSISRRPAPRVAGTTGAGDGAMRWPRLIASRRGARHTQEAGIDSTHRIWRATAAPSEARCGARRTGRGVYNTRWKGHPHALRTGAGRIPSGRVSTRWCMAPMVTTIAGALGARRPRPRHRGVDQLPFAREAGGIQ